MFFLCLTGGMLMLGAIASTIIIIGAAIEFIYDAFPIYSWEDAKDVLFGILLLALGASIGYLTFGMFYAIFIYH